MRKSNTTKNAFNSFQENRSYSLTTDLNQILSGPTKRHEQRTSVLKRLPRRGSVLGNAKELKRRFTMLKLREPSKDVSELVQPKTTKAPGPGPYMSLGSSMGPNKSQNPESSVISHSPNQTK